MKLTALEEKLGNDLEGQCFTLMGFDQEYKTSVLLKTLSKRLFEGEKVLFISPKTTETEILKMSNKVLLDAHTHGRLLISNQIKLEKLWAVADKFGVTTIVLDSLYDYTGKFTTKDVECIIKTAKEHNICIIITQPLSGSNKQELPTLLQTNMIKYVIRDRYLRNMDKVLIVYEKDDKTVELRTVKEHKRAEVGDLNVNFTKELLFK